MAQGSLVFGAANSDRASATSSATDSLDPFTYLALVYPTTLSTGRAIATKGTSANALRKGLLLSGTGGNLQMNITRATTNLSYITNTLSLATLSVWYLVAVTYNSANAANSLVKIYTGRMGPNFAAATSQAMGTTTDGTGTVTTDGSNGLFVWGNGPQASPTIALQGRIAIGAVFGIEFTLAQVQQWQLRPTMTVGANVAKDFTRFGKDGADAISYTGQTYTVTGATQGDGCPFYQGGGRWQQYGSRIFQSVQ